MASGRTDELRTLLRWYIDVRTVVAVGVLMVLLVLAGLDISPFPLQGPMALCLAELLLNLLYRPWLRSGRALTWLLHGQFVVDQVMLAVGILLTDGLKSPFLPLFGIVVLSAGLLSTAFSVLQAIVSSLILLVMILVSSDKEAVAAIVTVGILATTAVVISYYRAQVGREQDRVGSALHKLEGAYDELKRYEQDLSRTNAELKAAMSARAEFLRLVSHELRTPLNAVIGFSDLMMEPGMELSPEERARFLAQISRSGQHLLSIIDNMLEISRAEVTAPQVGPADAGEVVREIGESAAVAGRRKGLTVSYEVTGNGVMVRADPARLRQVLRQMVDNAMKFTEAGGEVMVRAAADGGWVEFAVDDTGPGVPSADVARVFEPFVQLDASTSREHEGTGLGLTVCRTLVQQMGGRIWAEPGPGGKFRFKLPVASRG